MLNSACSLTVRGVNFLYNFTAHNAKLERIREALYEDVENFDLRRGTPEKLVANNQDHVLELLNNIADIRLDITLMIQPLLPPPPHLLYNCVALGIYQFLS